MTPKAMKLYQIKRGLDTVKRTVEAIATEVNKILIEEEMEQRRNTPDSTVLRFIKERDQCGVNMASGELRKYFEGKTDQDFDEEIVALLKCGEVFEVADTIYPINTRNI